MVDIKVEVPPSCYLGPDAVKLEPSSADDRIKTEAPVPKALLLEPPKPVGLVKKEDPVDEAERIIEQARVKEDIVAKAE